MLESEGQAVIAEPVSGATGSDTSIATTPAPEQKGFVNSDGSFAEGWTKDFDAEVRMDKGISSFKTVKDLVKSYVSVRKMVGKEKIAIPTDKSSLSEWEAFYEAGGRPKTMADYKLNYPKDMPVPENEDMRKTFIDFAYKNGVSQKQMAGMYDLYNGYMKKEYEKQVQSQEFSKQEAVASLRESWGLAYEQRVHFGNVAVEEGAEGDDGFKERLISKFGNDADFIRYSSNLGNKFSEHRTISQNIPTPADYQTQIDELMSNPLYTKGTQTERMRIAGQLVQLREKMSKK